MNRPDHRTITAARRLDALAPLVTAAKDHIAEEFVRSDGAAAAQAFTDDGSRGSGAPKPVERTVLARNALTDKMLEINDDLDAVLAIIRSCTVTCRQVLGTRVPIEANRCEADSSEPGYRDTLAGGGWHDPLCENYARSATRYSLCNACRMRRDRWRAGHSLKPGDEDRPLEYDSKWYIDDLGVAHAEPDRKGAA